MVYLDGKDWNKHLDKVCLEKGSANTYKYFLFFFELSGKQKMVFGYNYKSYLVLVYTSLFIFLQFS